MNIWHEELMAEFHRQELLKEAEHIRLERIAVQSRAYRPRFFARTMFGLANWMISTGKQLRKRYEIPAVESNQTPTGSFAH